MKNAKAGLILILVVVLCVGAFFLVTNNRKVTPPEQTLVVSPTPTPTPAESKYSTELKAKVRSEFITNCETKGHYSVTECNCAVEYLAKNYTEDELAKIYVQYRTSSSIPAALEAARKACVNK